jgi:hypothetical protein
LEAYHKQRQKLLSDMFSRQEVGQNERNFMRAFGDMDIQEGMTFMETELSTACTYPAWEPEAVPTKISGATTLKGSPGLSQEISDKDTTGTRKKSRFKQQFTNS